MKSLFLQVESSPCKPRLARLPRRKVLLSLREEEMSQSTIYALGPAIAIVKAHSPFILESPPREKAFTMLLEK